MLKIRWNVSWLFGILLGIGVILTLVLPGDIPWREEEAELFREGTVIDDNEIVSAVDNDCSILRLLAIHDFGVRHEQSFVLATGIQTK